MDGQDGNGLQLENVFKFCAALYLAKIINPFSPNSDQNKISPHPISVL